MKYSEQELKQMAINAVNGSAFTSDQCKAEEVSMVFMPIALGAKLGDDVSMLYEEMDKASPMSCNGLPMFHSMKVLTKEEHLKFRQYAHEYYKLTEGFKNETP